MKRKRKKRRSSPSAPPCGAAAARGTWRSPETDPSGTSTCWRTSSWRAACGGPAPGRAASRGTRPWGTSGCRCTRAPACRLGAAPHTAAGRASPPAKYWLQAPPCCWSSSHWGSTTKSPARFKVWCIKARCIQTWFIYTQTVWRLTSAAHKGKTQREWRVHA